MLGVYLLTTGGETFISDGEIMLMTTSRIADLQVLTLPDAAAPFPQVIHGQGGFLFSRYGLGQPLAAAPLYWFGNSVVAPLLPGAIVPNVGRFLALLLPAFATALTGGVLCAWAARLYESVRIGVAVALLYGLGTLAWPFSRFFFSEPLFTCCLVLAAFALSHQRPLLAGLALGYATTTRLEGIFLLPAFALYAWHTMALLRTRPAPRYRGEHSAPPQVRFVTLPALPWTLMPAMRNRLRGFVWMAVGFIPGVLLILLHNWIRFRSLFERGYDDQGFTGNVLEGLQGLLLSPGKSVLLYVPLLILLPLAVWPFFKRCTAEAWFIGLLTFIIVLKSAWWWIWWAGWSWGPRFMVPLMPFLVLVLGVLLFRRRWRIVLLGVLLPISIALNLLGILVDFNDYLSQVTQGQFEREVVYLHEWQHSPIIGHLQMLDFANIPIVSFQLSRSDIGFPEPAATIISLAIVLLTVRALVGVIQALVRHR